MSGKNTENQSKQKKKGDILLTLVLIVAIAVFCYAAVNLFHIYTEYKKGTDEYNHIEQMAVTDRIRRKWQDRMHSQRPRSTWILQHLRA